MPIRIAGVVGQSIVDGPGLRFALFTQGCPHLCPGCHNPHTHPFDGGEDREPEELLAQIDANPLLKGVTLTGGEPLCQARALLPFAQGVKQRGKDIWCYTGYTFEELLDLQRADDALAQLLGHIDVLVDGRFLEAERDYKIEFRGSRNQRILDAKQSLAQNKAVPLR